MSDKKTSLGRSLNELGLSALLDALEDTHSNASQKLCILSVTQIQPGKYQPRHHIESESLTQMADSIRSQGVIQPIVVREIAPQQYEIIAGERRWRAAQQAGLQTIPALVDTGRSDTDTLAVALIENIQREDLNPVEKAQALQQLSEQMGLSHQQIATIIGQSRATVSNLIRLITLDPCVRSWLEQGDLDMGHARALLTLEPAQQKAVAQTIIENALSVRATENYVRRLLEQTNKPATAKTSSHTAPWMHKVEALQAKIQQHWKMKVEIKPASEHRGRIVLHYDDLGELERLLG